MADGSNREIPPPPRPDQVGGQNVPEPPPGRPDQEVPTPPLPDLERDVEELKEEMREERERQIEREQAIATAVSEGKKSFADLNIQFLEVFFDADDERTFRSLQSVDEFAKFTQEMQEKVKQEYRETHNGQDPAEEELNRLTSSRVEQEIVVRFSKLTRRVDQERASEFFEEIVQEGFFSSIQLIKKQLMDKVLLLTEEAEKRSSYEESDERALPEILREMKFFKRTSNKVLGEKEIEIDENNKKTISVEKIIPTSKDEAISAAGFLHALYTQIDNEYTVRAFMHNVRAIFFRGKGEQGFWAQLQNYATRLGTTDIDRLGTLPDNDLFMSAFQLYSKYVEERFALYDWVHQPNMFINNLQSTTSEIEDMVFEDLEKLFPDAAKDPWRVRRALNFGVGLSKGVFMTEVEAAAWADPNVRTDRNGEATFVSYYTNDNAAIMALNPLHHFLRWQQESMFKGPLLFMPVSGYRRRMLRLWDHAKLWERMKGFKNSWLKGKSAFNDIKTNSQEKTFFELLTNIGNIGSPLTRSGWRLGKAFEGWMDYESTTEEKGINLKVIDSWKAVENIGYEVLLNFVQNRITSDFLANNNSQREAFFKYLNERYINGDIDSETGKFKARKDLKIEVKETRNQLEKEFKDDPFKKNVQVKDEDIYERLLYKALTGVIRNRLPSKFVRIERDRLSDGGIRLWEEIRKDLKSWEESPQDKEGIPQQSQAKDQRKVEKVWSPEKMDKAMRNLMLVELSLRQETSARMVKYLEELTVSDKDKSLKDFDGSGYKVTPENINRILVNEMKLSQEEAEDAKKLFEKINGKILNNDFINQFASKIQNKEFPFALAAEELDTKFLAFRAAGESVLARNMGDNANLEQHVTDKLQGFLDTLHAVSLDPQHDISKIVDNLQEMKSTFEALHGNLVAFEKMHDFAGLTIAYFKKDTAAKNWVGRLTRFGRYNSIAAEVAGTFRGVWEWEAGEIDNFVVELERRRIVPKGLHELSIKNMPEVERRKKFFGIPMGYKITYDPKFEELTGKKMRKDFGGSKWDIASEILNKYIPLVMLFILVQAILRAGKEELGGKG